MLAVIRSVKTHIIKLTNALVLMLFSAVISAETTVSAETDEPAKAEMFSGLRMFLESLRDDSYHPLRIILGVVVIGGFLLALVRFLKLMEEE